MYVNGTKMPHSMRKIPIVTKANGRSLKTDRSGDILRKLVIGFLGSRLRSKIFAMIRRKSKIKPTIRIDQAKPTVGRRRWSMSGKTIPPMLPDVMAIPVAFPRFTRKKWPIEAMFGVLIRAPPRPLRTL